MQSHSVSIKPIDSRCRYWAKIVRSERALPMPACVQGANDIPGSYLQRGEEELLPGDVLFEGEANHHRRNDRGWTYWLAYVTKDGELMRYCSCFGAAKVQMKAQGMAPELLKGSGDVAGMVRLGHGLRAGLRVSVPEEG